MIFALKMSNIIIFKLGPYQVVCVTLLLKTTKLYVLIIRLAL